MLNLKRSMSHAHCQQLLVGCQYQLHPGGTFMRQEPESQVTARYRKVRYRKSPWSESDVQLQCNNFSVS